MAKLLGNSTYGKVIEVQQTHHWIESRVMCPAFEDMSRVSQFFARLYAESEPGEYDELVSVVIERARKHKIDCDERDCTGCGPEKTIENAEAMPLDVRMSAFKNYRCGQYFMPLYAAQTTGIVSACLGLMASVTHAKQGDTDSTHSVGTPDTSDYYTIMKRTGYDAPLNGIGQWASETKEPSVESILVRPKMYSHKFADGTYKQAKHGFAKFGIKEKGEKDQDFQNRIAAELHEALRRVLHGETVGYTTRAAPRRLVESVKTGKEIGDFVQRWIEVNAVYDPNLELGPDGINRWKEFTQ